MKKLPIVIGSAAAVAVAVLYFRADPVPEPSASVVAGHPPIVRSSARPTVATEQSPVNKKPQAKQILPGNTPQQNIEVAEEFPLPEPLTDEHLIPASDVELWRLPEDDSPALVEGLPATNFAVDPKVLERLQVGQVVRLQLPDGEGDVEAEIVTTYNDPAGVQVWTGKIKNDVNQASIIFTRGQIQTHIVIATTQGNFSAVVDNRSGDGTLINESTIHSRQLPYDDGIVYRPGDTETSHQH